MRNWIQKILGIDSIHEMINEINFKGDNSSADIVKLLTSHNETNYKLENISKCLEKNNETSSTLLEPISKIQLSNISGVISFKLNNNFEIDENWISLNSSKKAEFLFSQFAGTSAMASSTMYSTSGLYTATASINSLMTYGNGTLSSITINGSKFANHAGFVNANIAVFTPILAFQFASMITGQYYFNGLNKQLNSINESINNLISLQHNERLAKLRYINFKISELNKRSYFTIEDYMAIDSLKYTLSTIRYEYLLNAEQAINKSLDKSLDETTQDDNYDIVTTIEDTHALERMKLSVKQKTGRLLSIINDKFNNLYKDSALEKGLNSVQKLSENSIEKTNKLTNKLIDCKYFFYVDICLKAEHLYQLSKLLELKMNLSDREPDSNRIGKIKELYTAISVFNMDDSIFDDIEFINSKLRSKIVMNIEIFKQNSFFNKNEIIANGEKIISELNKSEALISNKELLLRDIEKIKIGFEKSTHLLIDNRNGKAEIYIKKTIAEEF
ncbi:hypothetical protein [Chryseobacterium vaccae]|uniref:hypothetical protein n=1 Tax=Chryseobacterium vaccae TaxID=2604424 RepID=UPI0012974C65|nr:hypothetical protein [Chryseobacterium vaccae]